MATEERDMDRVAVRTYVPAYQRDEWEQEADQLGMSRSEYVRTMVQAGRREFTIDEPSFESTEPVEPRSGGFEPRGEALRTRVLDVLEREGICDWEDLVSGVTSDLEEQVEDVIDDLQRENRIRYDGRRSGYTVIEDGE